MDGTQPADCTAVYPAGRVARPNVRRAEMHAETLYGSFHRVPKTCVPPKRPHIIFHGGQSGERFGAWTFSARFRKGSGLTAIGIDLP